MLRFLLGLALAAAPATAQTDQPLDRSTLHVQVILSKLDYSPGVLDGRTGESLRWALKAFQQSRDLPETGAADARTLRALHPHRAWRPTVATTLDASLLAGPFTNPLPDDPRAQAALPVLGYRNRLEALAERFHTTPEVLAELNPGARLVAGQRMTVPNALPAARDYPKDDPRWAATLKMLNVDSRVQQAERVEVDKSDGVLRVFDHEDRLVAQFPATMGSRLDPLPIGRWTIKGAAYNPDYSFDPKLLRTAKDSLPELKLPPGPNSPVGIVWLDLSKPHYGIHGTPEPHQIGRAESNGCIRLTNWDAARLALMVRPGTPAIFKT